MDHTVIALDLSSRPSRGAASSLLDALSALDGDLVASVSAFAGVEGWIAAALEGGDAADRRAAPPGGRAAAFDAPAIISRLRADHRELAASLGASAAATEAASLRIDRILGGLWTLVSCPAIGGSRRLRSLALGENLAATCVALALAALRRPTPLVEGSELGLGGSSEAERIAAKLGPLPGAVVPGLRAAWPIAAALGSGEPELVSLEAAPPAPSAVLPAAALAASARPLRVGGRERLASAPTVA